MSRYDTAFLEVEDSTDTAVFELSLGLRTSGELDKNYLMGSRGQYIQEIWDQSDALGEIDALAERRAGFWIDGGAGNYSERIEFEAGTEGESIQWGDGSGGDGQSNVTPRDASGAGVKPLTRYHIMSLWLARTLTDSRNPARLYFGEWADGTYHPEPGAFGQAMPCAITNFQPEMPDVNESPTSFQGVIEVSLLVPFGDYEPPDWMADSNVGTFVDHAAEQLGVIPDE
jgi:hypothetical protein